MFAKFKTYKPFLSHPLGAVFYLAFWLDLGIFLVTENAFLKPPLLSFTALFVLFCESFLRQEATFKKALLRPINLIILIAVFALAYPYEELIVSKLYDIDERYILYYFGGNLALFFGICALKFKDFQKFEGFVSGFFFSLGLWFLSVLLLLLFGASVDFLFDYDIWNLIYFFISLFAGLISLPLLGNLDFKFKGFIVKIFNLFALSYLLLLIIYAFTLPFGLEPKSVVHLCLWFGVFLIFLLWVNLASNFSLKTLKTIYLFAVFILASCAFYGIFVRVETYGFTITRLAVLFLSIWLLISVLLSIFWINRALKFSFIFLAVIALFLGCFSHQISLASQKAQLEMLKSKETFDKKDTKRFSNIKREIENLEKGRLF